MFRRHQVAEETVQDIIAEANSKESVKAHNTKIALLKDTAQLKPKILLEDKII
jgi:hypothetical protein